MRHAEHLTASPDLDWISGSIGRLADALGWPINWTAAADLAGGFATTGSPIDITDGDDTLGRIVVESPDDPRLTGAYESVCDVTELFAETLSRAARATHTARSRGRDVSALVDAVKTVPQTGDLQTAVGHLLRVATQLTGLWSAAFFLFDPRNQRLRLRATHQLAAKGVPQPLRAIGLETPDGLAYAQGAAILDRQIPADADWLPTGTAVGIGVPILTEGCLIGSLWCFDRRQRELGAWQIELLQSAAVQMAALLERTMLLQDSERQQQMTSELEFASRKLPVGLLQRPPVEWGVDLAVRAATVTGVGGDICDVIPLENRRMLIAIGDAVGHSVPAAMLASVARGALRALVSQIPANRLSTELLMVGVNRALHTVTQSEQFVTLMIGILDIDAATFIYTNAGHPPPLLLRDGEWRSLNSHGLFLGVEPETKYRASTVSLAPRDTLICYTDGVTETVNRAKVAFHRQGIQDTIPAANAATADAIAETIWQRVQAHDPDRPLRDDRTLLVLNFAGGS